MQDTNYEESYVKRDKFTNRYHETIHETHINPIDRSSVSTDS